MVEDFIAGNNDTEKAQNFADLTTISKVKAEFDIHAQVTVAAQSDTNYAAQKPLIARAETAHQPAVSKRVDELTDRMIAAVKDSDVEPARILNRLNRRLSKLTRKFMHARSPRWHRMRLRQEILEDFVRKLKELSSENGPGIDSQADDEEKAADLKEPAVVEMTASAAESVLDTASHDFHFEMEYSAAD